MTSLAEAPPAEMPATGGVAGMPPWVAMMLAGMAALATGAVLRRRR